MTGDDRAEIAEQRAMIRARIALGEVPRSAALLPAVEPSGDGSIWDRLLPAHGWTATGRPDQCGCPIWTAPGAHASPKSATAHEPGCGRFDTSRGWGPLKVWTDHPPDELAGGNPRSGSSMWTPLDFVAAMDHDGNVAAAMDALGIARRGVEVPPAWEVPSDWRDAEPPAAHRLAASVYDANDLDDLPSPEPLIGGVLDVGTVAMLAGKFGTYKTFLALSWAGHLATGQGWSGHPVPAARPVMYVAAEGVTGLRRRLAAWRSKHGDIPRGMLTVIARPVRLTDDDDVAWVRDRIRETDAGLVVFDTFHRCAPGVEENSAKEMGAVVDRVASLRDDTGCTALLLHHTGHAGERARGSSVNEDDLDTSWVVRLAGDQEDRGPRNPRVLHHRKVKDGELCEPVPLALVTVPGTGSAYVDTDPFASVAADAATEVHALAAVADALGLPKTAGRDRLLQTLGQGGRAVTKEQASRIARLRKNTPRAVVDVPPPPNLPDLPAP